MKNQVVSKKNAAILRRAKKAILKHPYRYDQDDYCGTECCIAGHIVANEKPNQWKTIVKAKMSGRGLICKGDDDFLLSKKFEPFDLDAEFATVHLTEKILVDLDTETLFYPADDWPKPFCDDYEKAPTHKKRAEVAARRIEHFIKTGD